MYQVCLCPAPNWTLNTQKLFLSVTLHAQTPLGGLGGAWRRDANQPPTLLLHGEMAARGQEGCAALASSQHTLWDTHSTSCLQRTCNSEWPGSKSLLLEGSIFPLSSQQNCTGPGLATGADRSFCSLWTSEKQDGGEKRQKNSLRNTYCVRASQAVQPSAGVVSPMWQMGTGAAAQGQSWRLGQR